MGLAQPRLIPGPFGFGLGDPRGNRDRACPGVEGGAVLDQLPVAFSDLASRFLVVAGTRVAGLPGCDEVVNSLAEAVRGELPCQPVVYLPDDHGLAQEHAQRMLDVVRERTRRGSGTDSKAHR